MWITESGGNYYSISANQGIGIAQRSLLEEQQRKLVRANMNQSKAAQSVFMWTQYLHYSDPCFDSGCANEIGGPHGNCFTYDYPSDYRRRRSVFGVFADSATYGANIY